MAIYSLQVKAVSRSDGRSVVAAAAYRAAEKITDERLGVVWDFTRKGGVLHAEIITPKDAPGWARDRAELWNAAERAEDKSTRRAQGKTGRDIILALPHELNDQQRLDAVRQFAAALVERYGVAVDFAIHAPDRRGDERNFHAHLLMTTRRLGPAGFGRKTRELDDYTTGPREIEAIRRMWERIGNATLERAGLDIRIDCRSFADRGVDREATVHLGPVASGMERKGAATELGDRNRAAQARNAERERLNGDRAAVSAEIIDLAAERARRIEERELRAAVRTHSPLKILEALTEKRSTFSRGDLNRLLAKVILDPKARAALTGAILARREVVGLSESAAAPVSRYTTRAVLADEDRVMRDAAMLAAAARHGVGGGGGDAILARYPRLNDEQRAAFRHAIAAGGLAVIAGESGTGKSETLAAVRDAYEAAGFRVIGMAWTNSVVQDMQRAGFGNAATIASELKRIETGAGQWDARTVLVVDEAAMLATRHLAAVTHAARAAGAKLILAGDDKQLASIERGGLFGALQQTHGAAELHEVVRVSDAEQRRAFNLMHKGEFLPALRIFARQGAICWKGTQEEALAALVGQWTKDIAADPGKSRFVFAYTNADVGELNAALRAVRRGQGALGSDHMLVTAEGPMPFAANDRVQFVGSAWRRADRQAGLANGVLGTIRSIEGERVTVVLDGKPGAPQRVVSFIAGTDREGGQFGQFRHGYAGTIYKGQGRTLDATYLYHSQHWRSAASYVALTRHREGVALFAATGTARDLGQLARQMALVDDCRAASQFHIAQEFDRVAAGGASPRPRANSFTAPPPPRTARSGETRQMSDPTPEVEAAEQQRRQAAMLETIAREARRATERLATERMDQQQAAQRQAEALREAAETRRRLDEFMLEQQRLADEERRKREREIEEQARSRAGDVSDAHSRYAVAVARHYDIRDPYDSLGRAAMAEYGEFRREQERLRREIAREADPEKRRLLELQRGIESAEYIAITSERMAGISRAVSGRNDNLEALRDDARAEAYLSQAQDLREERASLFRLRLAREAGTGQRDIERGRGPGGGNGPESGPPTPGQATLSRNSGTQHPQQGDGAAPNPAIEGMSGQPAQQTPQQPARQELPAPGAQPGDAARRPDQPARGQTHHGDRPTARGPYAVLGDPAQGAAAADAEPQRELQQQSGTREPGAAPGKAADPADKMANVEMTDRRAAALAKIRERHQENDARDVQREQNRQIGRSPGRSR